MKINETIRQKINHQRICDTSVRWNAVFRPGSFEVDHYLTYSCDHVIALFFAVSGIRLHFFPSQSLNPQTCFPFSISYLQDVESESLSLSVAPDLGCSSDENLLVSWGDTSFLFPRMIPDVATLVIELNKEKPFEIQRSVEE